MAQKSVKKPATKTAAAKKTKAPAATKKVAPQKVAPKKTAPMMETHGCACGNDCHCGPSCKCGDNCRCGAGCACGSACHCHGGFGRFMRKLIVFLVIFALGWAAAGLFQGGCPMGKRGMMHKGPNPRVHFVNGCLDATSVKCPKMAEMLVTMDADENGCITRAEYKAARRGLRAAKQVEQPMEKPAETTVESPTPTVAE